MSFHLKPGDEVCRGKYRLIRALGAGGFALVFEAENLLTKRRVALKAVHGESAGPEVVARLRREAVVSSRVRHRHIVDVYDLEEEAGIWFLVMEYVRGETLRAALDRSALTPDVSIALLCSVMRGLSVMHKHGVVHRDIKPENIYLARQHDTAQVVAKLLDFGICKVEQPDSELPPLTRAGTQGMGTLLYMSPEQYADSAGVDARADVYSMGVVLYECLTGMAPHEAPSQRELTLKILTTLPVPPHEVRPEVSRELGAIAMKALAHDPVERQQSIDELAQALAPFAAESLPQADQVLAPRASQPPAAAVPKRRSGWLAALATVLTAQVSGLYWAAVSTDGAAWAALFSPQRSVLAGLLLPPTSTGARTLQLPALGSSMSALDAAIEVFCEIPGAELYVNGEPVGLVLTNGPLQLSLPAGMYRFEAMRDGAVVASDFQLVQPGASLALHLHAPGATPEAGPPPQAALVSTARLGPAERRAHPAALGLGAALSEQQLADVIRSHQAELQHCYESTVPERDAPGAPVSLELEVAIAAAGEVSLVHSHASSLGAQPTPALDECIERAARAWKFPEAARPTQLRFPLTFRRAGSSRLSAAQLSAVVARSKGTLQRCYGGAAYGSEALRLDVDMEVLPSGAVSSVAIASDHPELDACISRMMRLWQFPSAEGATRTRFPVLLLPGA